MAEHQTKTNERTHRYINIMEAQQSFNFIFADIKFRNRRVHSGNKSHARFVANGKEDGYIRITFDWIVDYLLYLLCLIWGIIQPIVLILVMLIVRVVLIIVLQLLAITYFIN